MSLHSESLRALSEARDWYARQSQMTVFGTVPSLRDVKQNFSDSLAMAVGLFPGTQSAIAIPCKPHSPAAVGWVPSNFEVK